MLSPADVVAATPVQATAETSRCAATNRCDSESFTIAIRSIRASSPQVAANWDNALAFALSERENSPKLPNCSNGWQQPDTVVPW